MPYVILSDCPAKCVLCYNSGYRPGPQLYCDKEKCHFAPDDEKIHKIYPSMDKETRYALRLKLLEAEGCD